MSSGEAARGRRLRRTILSLAGPALIVAAVPIVLRRFAFQGLVDRADALTFFLPNYCFLGRSLANSEAASRSEELVCSAASDMPQRKPTLSRVMRA